MLPSTPFRSGLVALARPLACLLLLVLLATGRAADPAGDFAGLTVTSYGRQSYDLATRLTVLPDGGEVVDRERDVRLVGRVVRYREGTFVELEDAEARGDFGLLAATLIRLDMEMQTLVAEGEVRLEAEGVGVSAERMRVLLAEGVVVAEGAVRGEAPVMLGRALVIDLNEGSGLLVGPYRFEDGPLTLESDRSDDLLELVLVREAQNGVSVATEPDAQRLARLGAFLPE